MADPCDNIPRPPVFATATDAADPVRNDEKIPSPRRGEGGRRPDEVDNQVLTRIFANLIRAIRARNFSTRFGNG
jgi:hypothetical protein